VCVDFCDDDESVCDECVCGLMMMMSVWIVMMMSECVDCVMMIESVWIVMMMMRVVVCDDE